MSSHQKPDISQQSFNYRDTREAEEEGGEGTSNTELEPVIDVEEEAEGDVGVTADEPVPTIKEDNVIKCSKCLKNSFRYRHDGFCGKCVHQDIINVHEQEKIAEEAVKCYKCARQKFRARNVLLCSDICDVKVELPIPTEVVPVEKYKEVKEAVKVVTKKKKYEEMEKPKKKNQKHEEREKRRKEKQQRKLEKKNKKFVYAPTPVAWTSQNLETTNPTGAQMAQLNPLGHLLKAIIVANTW